MKKYSTAAVAIALGISEITIEAQFEGASKKGVDLAQILQLADNAKLSRYNEEAAKISKIMAGVQSLEA